MGRIFDLHKMLGSLDELMRGTMFRGETRFMTVGLPSLKAVDCAQVTLPMGFALHPDHNTLGIEWRVVEDRFLELHFSLPSGTPLHNVELAVSSKDGDFIVTKSRGCWVLVDPGELTRREIQDKVLLFSGSIERRMDAILFTSNHTGGATLMLVKSI